MTPQNVFTKTNGKGETVRVEQYWFPSTVPLDDIYDAVAQISPEHARLKDYISVWESSRDFSRVARIEILDKTHAENQRQHQQPNNSELVAVHFTESAKDKAHKLRGYIFDEEIVDLMVFCQQRLCKDARKALLRALRDDKVSITVGYL